MPEIENQRSKHISEIGIAGLIFLSGLVIRLAYLFRIKENPSFYNLFLDCRSYHEWALKIVSGHWFRADAFYQDPLYPYFLALVYKVFGQDPLAARIVQSIIGSCNGVLIYYAGREFFGQKAGIIAGFISAFYGVFLFFDGMINKPFLSVFFVNCSLLTFAFGLKHKQEKWFFFQGIFLGFLVLIRANILLLIPLFLTWAWFTFSGNKKLLNCASMIAGIFLSVSPATLHNYLTTGDFILSTTQAGQNFYIGNHPDNNTGTYRPPKFLRATPEFEETDFKARAEFITGKKMSPKEVSSFWTRETINIILSDPQRFAKHLWFKIRLFLNKYEVPDNHSYSFFQAYYSSILNWNILDFRIIGPLGLAGLVFSLFGKTENKSGKFLPLFFLVYMGSIVPFYVFSRYRIPVVPVLILLSAFFIVLIARRIREKKYMETTLGLFIAIFFWAFVNADIKKDDFSPQFGNIGYSYMAQGKMEEALLNYQKAIEIDPGYAEPYYFTGRIFAEMGDLKQAEKNFKKSVTIEPGLYVGYSGLGIISALLGKTAEAEFYLKKAIDLKPYSADAHNNLGVLYQRLGKEASARIEFKKALSLKPDSKAVPQNLDHMRLK